MVMKIGNFKFEFGDDQIDVIYKDGEPWFVASQVAKVLGYSESTNMVRMLDDEEAAPHLVKVRSTNNVEQVRTATIINESGLYSCILKSKRPTAKAFKKWVTAEVLPSIRKTGSYHISQLEQQLEQAQPKVRFCDDYVIFGEPVCLREAARLLSIPERQFVNVLSTVGVLSKQQGVWHPKSTYRDKGYFKLRLMAINGGVRAQTQVTPIGLIWLGNKYSKMMERYIKINSG
jgi:prophage antirepressor-like protein